ncbi:MAG TPA: NFACT RNA binding domain-containing protein [Clostridia bacterium]|nr:NFACT RNA binding domain-containing protein [Clostridia bacterium]
MPFDGSVVNSIVHELNEKLVNGKIDKVYQPEKDELLIHIRSYKDSFKLLLSASSTYPRVHLTGENKSNPTVPPSFCMLLRKHLLGGRVVSVRQPDFERIIEIDIDSADEMGYSTHKALIAEIMGRHSNIIFIDRPTGRIIDSIKRVSFEISSVREILPGGEYEYPPSGEKTNPLTAAKESFYTAIARVPGSIRAEKFLMNTYNGISPAVARNICLEAAIDCDTDLKQCSTELIGRLHNAFSKFQEAVLKASFKPNIVYKDGKASDFSCFILGIYKGYDIQEFSNISETVERFYHEKDSKDRIKQKSGDIHKIIANRLDRCYKKLEILNSELQDAADSEKYKIYGDLIMSNIYDLHKGQEKVRLQNYYSPEGEFIEISMDTRLSPSANAQRYYKHYNKSKNAINKINDQLEENKQEIMYLETQLDNLDKCTEELEIEEIRNELAEQGYTKARKAVKNKQSKASKPMRYISSSGFEIYVGKNNVQNDYLTLKFATNQDVWLHTKDIPGSHVIIKTEGKEVDDTTLEEAANLAAFYSKGRMSSKVPVDYTRRKNVKKPGGAKPGMVIYDNYFTMYMTPDEERINNMKK